MKKIINWYFFTKKEKAEIESQDKQYETALHRISKLEKHLEIAKEEIDRQIALKNKYLESCKDLRLKLNQVRKELKEFQNEIKTSEAISSRSARKQSRSTKR
jgi:hypothetical protein